MCTNLDWMLVAHIACDPEVPTSFPGQVHFDPDHNLVDGTGHLRESQDELLIGSDDDDVVVFVDPADRMGFVLKPGK